MPPVVIKDNLLVSVIRTLILSDFQARALGMEHGDNFSIATYKCQRNRVFFYKKNKILFDNAKTADLGD